MDILSYIGKFHPVVLHLPIGFLLLAFMMEIHDRWKKKDQFQPAIGFTLFWGMIGAIVAAGTGYFLSLNGGYEEVLLNRHQWLGLGVTVGSIVLYFLHRRKVAGNSKFYFPLFGLSTILLFATGHFGGSLTHGSDFLSPFAKSRIQKKEIVDIENALVFEDIIQPILKEKCVRCHSKSKTKGDLLMATIEGLKKGGKSGALFVKGNTKNSLMLERIHMPLAEKKHMPPKGKKQLLADEIKLISWWIQEGADFDKKVKDLQKPENINTILNKYITQEEGLQNIQVTAVKEGTLKNLRAKGIPVFKLAKNSNFVEVDLSRKTGVNKGLLSQLKAVEEQLVSLNLANTDIQDDDLKIINSFPHLEKLFLQQTAITDKGIQQLENLAYLSYLNLYQTKISDKSLAFLSKFKRLEKLFLWQTSTSPEGVAKFINNKPKAKVNTGIDKTIFGDSSLKPPTIIAEKDLFKDSLVVELKMNFKNVNIYYTLDGSIPDSTTNLYEQPLVLKQTTELKVIAQKTGWQSSEVKTKQFANVKYIPKRVKLNQPPSEKYAAKKEKSLFDLEKGSTTFSDGMWLGYEKQHLIATFDLGKKEAVSAVTVGALEAPGSYIFYPKGLTISLSNDGKTYHKIATSTYPIATENKPNETKNFTQSFDTQSARFVKVKVESHLVNPDWHPAPGAPCWIFVDEISIE